MRYFFLLLLLSALTACTAPPEESAATDIPPVATITHTPEIPTPTPTNEPTLTAVQAEDTPEVTQAVVPTADAENGRFPNLNGRTITIAVENSYLPFNYILLETGEPGGWDYDAWREICALLNCVPVFETAVWPDILQLVVDGQVDVAANGISMTPARAELVDFSDGYMSMEQRLMARSAEHLFTAINEFVLDPSFTVGVRAHDTPFDTASDLLDSERIQTYTDHQTLFDALGNGEVDGMIIPVLILDRLQQDYVGVETRRFKFASGSLAHERLGFIFAQGSDLVQPVNLALRELHQNGTLDALAQSYFTDKFKVTYSDIE